MLAYATSGDLALRVPLLPTLFRMQFPVLVLIAIAVGWLWLLHRDRGIALSLLTAWFVQTFVTITYRAPQTVEYLMPAYVPMAGAWPGRSLEAHAEIGSTAPPDHRSRADRPHLSGATASWSRPGLPHARR